MRGHKLAEVRVASEVTGDFDVLVIGSQSILGSYPDNELPPMPPPT